MRLVTYDQGQGSPERVGALRGDAVIDVGFDGDMVAFIAAGELEAARTPRTAEAVPRGCAHRCDLAPCATS